MFDEPANLADVIAALQKAGKLPPSLSATDIARLQKAMQKYSSWAAARLTDYLVENYQRDIEDKIKFTAAIDQLQSKGLLPTNLSSADLRGLAAEVKRQNIFSAQTTDAEYLAKIQAVTESLIHPRQAAGLGHTVTEGLNPATARAALRAALKARGYTAAEGEQGSIKDLASDARLNLVVKTNMQLAQGAGSFIQANQDQGVVDEYPAMELVRFEEREKPRNWGGEGTEKKGSPFGTRWMLAAQTCGDSDAARVLDETGRMVALKSSDIWQALGDGAGGFDDTLGNPYPPFAFNSGMWWEEVSRKDAVKLGLLDEDEQAEPAKLSIADLFKAA